MRKKLSNNFKTNICFSYIQEKILNINKEDELKIINKISSIFNTNNDIVNNIIQDKENKKILINAFNSFYDLYSDIMGFDYLNNIYYYIFKENLNINKVLLKFR